ncbi:enoyl-CoA hydratase/isomerase family protein [Brevibacterium sp. FME37]|uniref:enoyl-CoA hydratase/isomerase family protein n=1 Tax=Brevibacterium sp. FME37 TaxID=2742607 RepID=UPI001868A62D|nr:enoyl-CoA hydratase/isomerase family protein [Brevibacterium sp. FME37]
MTETTQGLIMKVDGSVATIWIRNEGRRNAMTSQMWEQFPELIARARAHSAVMVIVLRGFGDDFSAGADISELRTISTAKGSGGASATTKAETAIASSPKPTVAAIDGYCIGGGWEIAAACDFRVATRNAKLAITPSKMGIVYPLSAIKRLVDIAGPSVAKDLLLTGRMLTAEQALGFGMVTQLAGEGELTEHIAALADQLGSRSQLSIQAMKNIVDAIVADADVESREGVWRSEVETSGERETGVQAFLDRRPAEFGWTGERFWNDHPEVGVHE